MKVDLTIAWSITNDQDMVDNNYIGVWTRRHSEIAIMDTFQVKFLHSRKVVKYIPICTQENSSNMHFTVIFVHLDVVVREGNGYVA